MLATSVKLWVSVDSGWTYDEYAMSGSPATEYTADVILPPGCSADNIIFFVEASGGGLTFTSLPVVPLPPKLRPYPWSSEVGDGFAQLAPAVRAKPNPFGSFCEISVPGDARVLIVDLGGRVVASFPRGDLPRGAVRRLIWLPDAALPAGVYVVDVVCGRVRARKRVLYLR